MAINIKSPDCERLVRELADLTGDSITDAIHTAVRERLTREKLRKLGGVERSWQRIERIQERIRAFPPVVPSSPAGRDAPAYPAEEQP